MGSVITANCFPKSAVAQEIREEQRHVNAVRPPKSLVAHPNNKKRVANLQKKWRLTREKYDPNNIVNYVSWTDINEMPNPLFVDCRGIEDREVSVLPQAMMSEDFLRREDKYLSYTATQIVLYGRTGKLALLVALQVLKRHPTATNLSVYKGSFIDWCHNSGQITTRKGKETEMVYVDELRSLYPLNMGYEYIDPQEESISV